jgi:sugar phosphate isomerase/epimerase
VCGLLVDTAHVARSGGGMHDVACLDSAEIAAMQVADAVAVAPADIPAESRNLTAAADEGALDIAGFAGALADHGWTGTIRTEVLSSRLRALRPADNAGQCLASVRKYFPEQG